MAPIPVVESEVALDNQPENAPEAAPSKPTIGIIYPPPELRSILEIRSLWFNNLSYYVKNIWCF